jgi:hypothetical protein
VGSWLTALLTRTRLTRTRLAWARLGTGAIWARGCAQLVRPGAALVRAKAAGWGSERRLAGSRPRLARLRLARLARLARLRLARLARLARLRLARLARLRLARLARWDRRTGSDATGGRAGSPAWRLGDGWRRWPRPTGRRGAPRRLRPARRGTRRRTRVRH